MPAGFDKCRKQGGKIRTVNLKGGKYKHVCYIGGKSYPGYTKTKKRKGGKKKMTYEAMSRRG